MPKKKSMEDRIAALEAKINGTPTTRILVIQDISYSMMSRRAETISGYNEYIESLAEDDSDTAYLTLVQFDDFYEVKEKNKEVSKLEPLTEHTFQPRGWTALLDAVGKGITEFKKTLGEGDRAFVVIMTDGGENASTQFNRTDISKLIKQCEDEGNWTFTFLGAGRDSWGGAEQLGLGRRSAAFYGEDGHSHSVAFASLGDVTRSYRGSGASVMEATGATVSNLMAKEGAAVELEEDEPINGIGTRATKSQETGEKVTSGSES